MTEGRKYNRLGGSKAATLTVWINDNKEMHTTFTAAELANEASTMLGFNVTEANIGHTRRSLGIVRPTKAKEEKDQVREGIRVLAKQIEAILVHLSKDEQPDLETGEFYQLRKRA